MDSAGIRVSIVLSSLRCGGVERAVATLSGTLARRGYRVTVLTYDESRTDFFSLAPEVKRVSLGLTSAPAPLLGLVPRAFRTLRTLRAALLATEPQVVIAHMARMNVHTLLALANTRIPVVVTEHGDVSSVHWRKGLWYRVRRLCYRFAFRAVSVSHAVDRNCRWLPKERRLVIPNPIAVKEPAAARSAEPRSDCVISVGRLSHVKGFDILIAAFARIAGRFPQWRLVIVGGGEDRSALERQAAALRLRERIVFTGALADPSVMLRRAKLFAMASRYEGFPLAHAEAMACGLPVIATDCPSGPLARNEQFAGGVRELVRPGVNGLLVRPGDPQALANAMAELMSDPSRREALARRAPEVLERLAPERIADAWEQLISEAIGRTKSASRQDAQETPCVVITGPVMSAISGISTHIALLSTALRNRFAVVHFPIGGEGLQESILARGLRLFAAPVRLAMLLRGHRPSVVHVNTSLSWRACIRDALIVATCRLCGQRFILQFHGGHLPASPALRERAGRWILGRFLRLPERIVAISREDETFYRSVATPSKVVRIENGVEPRTLTSRARFKRGRLRLLHFSRLAEDKGLLDILDALAVLRGQDLLERVSLVVAGNGPLRAVADKRVVLQRIESSVRFVGAAFGARKDDLMANSDLFVLPTYHPERLPYALLESMAAGVVPITCGVGAIADVVRHQREGFLVQPREPEALARLLADLLSDPGPLVRMSAACRQTIRDRYSLERMAAEFGALYDEAVAPALRLPRGLGVSEQLR